jgi:Bifunctional DNA primase/polymerase, N-terminal
MMNLDAALDLAAYGLAVFPLNFPKPQRDGTLACSCGRSDCENPAKHPFGLRAPNGFKNATLDYQRITQWWRRYPQLNIGVATGDVIVLDVDPRHGGFDSLAELEAEHDVLPHTWTVRTGGNGRHLYFAGPSGVTIRNSVGRLGPGLDIRGAGGFSIAPSSRHISGARYSWEAPDEAPLAPMPTWLIDKLTPPPPPPICLAEFRANNSPARAAARITAILLTVARAHQGERNQVAFWGACRLFDMVCEGAIDHAAGMDALAQLRLAAAHAGLGPREINLTITSALRRGAA